MGKRTRKIRLTTFLLILILLFCNSCGTSTDKSVKILMETSTEAWPAKLEKACGLKDLGCPLGTVKEEYSAKKGVYEVRFSIDEAMSQTLVDGYAKAVWQSCVEAGGGRPHSCNYYIYGNFKEACRQQEPLSYYIWYYFLDQKEYRVGIYPTNLEEGEPGGLVLRIEKWKQDA